VILAGLCLRLPSAKQTRSNLIMEHNYAIPAGPLAAAIEQFQKQSGVKVVIRGDKPSDKESSPAIQGRMSPEVALKAMISNTSYGWQPYYAEDIQTSIILYRRRPPHVLQTMDAIHEFDIPSNKFSDAIFAWGVQSDVAFSYPTGLGRAVYDTPAPTVKGRMSSRDALTQLTDHKFDWTESRDRFGDFMTVYLRYIN
jgi:hypothetical protein